MNCLLEFTWVRRALLKEPISPDAQAGVPSGRVLFLCLCKHTDWNDFPLFILLTSRDQIWYYPNGGHSPCVWKIMVLHVSWWLSNSMDYLYNMMKGFKNVAVMIIGSRIYQGVNRKGLLISISPTEPLQLINNCIVRKGTWSLKINDPIDTTVSSRSIAPKRF